MTALDIDVDLFAGFIDGLLCPEDGGGRLYMRTDQNTAAVADAAENAARVVCPLGDLAVLQTEEIIVLAACPVGNLTAVADFHSLDCADGHDGLCEACVQLLKYRIADSGGKTVHDTLHTAADGVTVSLCLFEKGDSRLARRPVRHCGRCGEDGGAVKALGIDLYRTNGARVGTDDDAKLP